MYYLLDKNRKPFPVTLEEMGEKFESSNKERIIKKTYLEKYKVEISTVFLGIDHGFLWADDPSTYKPILFETMIFWSDDQELDQWQDRYRTWKAAYYGHNHAVRLVIDEIRRQLKENPNKEFKISNHWNKFVMMKKED